MIMEIQMMLGHSMAELSAEHIWSENNAIADKLSRMAEGAELPEECRYAEKDDPRRRQWKFLSG